MVTPADLVAPKGELEASLFPKEDIAASGGRLEQYLSEVNGSDEAKKAYAYYRAYRAVYVRMSSTPIRASLDDQGSREFDKGQADRFLALSEEWRAVYDVAIAVAVPQRVSSTAAVATRIVW